MPKKKSRKKVATPKKAAARAKIKRKTPAGVKSSAVEQREFAAAFDGLKRVITAFAPELWVSTDEPQKYYLVTKSHSWKGGPMFFGAVVMGKAYVSYHLMALYSCPELLRLISPELKKRMQGKSCFNFKAPDEALFAELGELTRAGLEKYRAKNWL
jgi:hypothetical protein